jgi:hypothetical protein
LTIILNFSTDINFQPRSQHKNLDKYLFVKDSVL